MAIASLIVSIAGIVLSFLIGFPFNYIIGPAIGVSMGIVGLVLAAVARKKEKTTLTTAALVISTIIIAVCVIRAISFATCVGRVSSCVAGLIAGPPA